MVKKSEYAVLQFVEQGQYSHAVHLIVPGRSVMEYAKEEVRMDKEKIIELAQSFAIQLREYYKCGEQEAYGYVNPYAVIITEENEIRLLDVEAEENQEFCVKMQKKKVRQLFVRPEHALSQKRRREDDLYGFGKCIQFMIEKCCTKKRFTLREQAALQRIYLKCESGGKAEIVLWQQFSERLEKLKKKEKDGKNGKMTVLLIVAAFLIGIGISQGKDGNQKSDVQLEEQVRALEEEVQQAEESLELEQKYVSCLELVQKLSLSDAQRETLANDFEVIQEKKKTQLESKDGQRFTALIYEKLYQYEAAITIYEDLKKVSNEELEKKEIYKKLMELYETMDMPEQVITSCEEAIEEYPELREDEKFSKYYIGDVENMEDTENIEKIEDIEDIETMEVIEEN